MTKRECAIVEAFTGICMLTGKDTDIFYKYISDKLGFLIYTHELADKEVQEKIKEAARADFIELCRTATDE